MRPVFVSSTGNQAGQTLLAWALFAKLRKMGYDPGFCKPLGRVIAGESVDHDVSLFKRVFGLNRDEKELCAALMKGSEGEALHRDAFLESVGRQVSELRRGRDAFLLMGTEDIFFNPEGLGLPDTRMVDRLDAEVVLVDRYREDSQTIYTVLAIESYLGSRLKGIVINRVPPQALENLRDRLVPRLRNKGAPILAVVPEDRILAASSVADYANRLSGEVLSGKENLHNLVTGHTTGILPLPKSLDMFRRIYNKIVLKGGPRDLLADPEAEPGLAGILLTAGRKPPAVCVEAAEELGVPLVAVSPDSFEASDILEKSRFPLSPDDGFKAERFLAYMDEQVDFQALFGKG